jgi:hypothetical protein
MKANLLFVMLGIGTLISCKLPSSSENTASLKYETNLADFNCTTKQVKYLEDSVEYDGILLFVNHYDIEMPLQFTNVYLLTKHGKNVQLIGDTAAFTGLYDVSVSDNYRYLAAYFVAEGHPWIEIYDLSQLINSGTKELIAELNPYPGIINLVGWEGEVLVVGSDVNLLLKNQGKQISEMDMFETQKQFSFDMGSKMFLDKK